MSEAEPKTTWDGLPIASEWPTGAAVVVWRAGANGVELLLLHRAHHGPEYEGDWAWTPPTGARFPGEEVVDCAARELHEEAGLSLPMTRLDEGESWARFVAEAPADVVVTLHDAEHDRYEWVTPETALRRVAPERVRDGLRKALAYVAGQSETVGPETGSTA